jgi:opacity protein-like surface antigen
MRRKSMLHSLCVACTVAALAIIPASAQEFHHYNFSAGGGFSVPTSHASSSFNTGWNLDFRGGLTVSSNFLADLDFSYNQWGLTNSTLASFGQPNGHADVWSLTFTPVIRLAPHYSPVKPYILAGAGLYHRGLVVSHPANFTTVYCDPFFGFCYPTVITADQVAASFSTYKGGFNAGGGLEYRVGNHNWKIFSEARYNQMFTARGPDLSFVPVTLGVRW